MNDAIYEQALELCREKGMRITRSLKELLLQLSRHDEPLTLSYLSSQVSELSDYDPSTIYRLLQKLESAGIVRRFGFHERAGYYQLKRPGSHAHFVVCGDCGKLEALDIHCPVQALDEEVVERTGFSNIQHDLSFYGLCPDCKPH